MKKAPVRSVLLLAAAGAFALSQPAIAQHHEGDAKHKTDEHAGKPADHDAHDPAHKDDAHKSDEHKDDHAQHPQGH